MTNSVRSGCAAAAGCLLLGFIFYRTGPAADFCSRDFFAFWAAGRNLVRGLSPFGTEMFPTLAREARCPAVFPYSIANPPWMNPLLAVPGYFTFRAAGAIWMIINLFLLFASLSIIFSMASKEDFRLEKHPLTIASIFSFEPVYFNLYLGQISIFVLFCYVLFLYLFFRGRSVSAGCALALTLIKPQLLYTVYFLLLALGLRRRRYPRWNRALLGFVAAFITMNAAGYLMSPDSYANYLERISPSIWHTPTFSAWIRSYFPGLKWLIPALPICASLYVVREAEREHDEMRLCNTAAIIGLCTTPYLWTYDYVLLLAPVLFMLVSCSDTKRRIELPLLIILGNAALMLGPADMRYALWVPCYVLLLWKVYSRSLLPGQR